MEKEIKNWSTLEKEPIEVIHFKNGEAWRLFRALTELANPTGGLVFEITGNDMVNFLPERKNDVQFTTIESALEFINGRRKYYKI